MDFLAPNLFDKTGETLIISPIPNIKTRLVTAPEILTAASTSVEYLPATNTSPAIIKINPTCPIIIGNARFIKSFM